MAGYSARQSTYVDTDTILAAHSNDEFNAILAAFHLTTGHKHDGSTAGDGPLLVITGALNSGSITSGFGTIDTGSSTITTTGLISGGSLDIDNVLINGTTIGHTDDTDLMTVTDGLLTVAGEISVTTLDIGGTNVTTTAAEINLIDGGTSRGTTSVASGDGILINDDGTMAMTNVDTVSTYFASHSVGGGNIVTTGALDTGSITSGFGTIDTGASAITTTGLISGGSLDIDNVLINGTTIGHTDDSDLLTLADGALTVDGTITVGVDDAGHDVKLFGHAAGAYMEYDASADQLRIMGASADAVTSTGKLLLATSLTDINNLDVIGKVDFQAPHEAGGTDAITVAASIQAIAQATFSGSVNETDLIFYTGHSEAATEKFRFTSQGEIGIAGNNVGTDGQVLTSGGTGAAAAWEDAGGGAVTALNNATQSELVTVGSTTTELDAESNLTFDGSTLTVTGAAGISGALTAASLGLGDETVATYDTGTFTPTITFGGNAVSLTYSTQSGRYMKFGIHVFIDLVVILSDKGSSSGTSAVAGLPFTKANISDNLNLMSHRFDNINLATNYTGLFIRVNTNNTTLDIREIGDNVGASIITEADFADDTIIAVTGWYEAAS